MKKGQIWTGYHPTKHNVTWLVVTDVDDQHVWVRTWSMWWLDSVRWNRAEFESKHTLWADLGSTGLPDHPYGHPLRNDRDAWRILSSVRNQLADSPFRDSGYNFECSPAETLTQVRRFAINARNAMSELFMRSDGSMKEWFGHVEGSLSSLIILLHHDAEKAKSFESHWDVRG